MFRFPQRLFSIFAIALLLSWPTHDLLARGGRGGSFGGSSSRVSRPSFSSSSSRSSSGWSSSSSRSSSGWGSSSSSRSSAPSSTADSALTTKVNRGGTSQSRGEAIDSRSSPSTSYPSYDRSPSRSSSSNTSSSSQRSSGPPPIPQGMTLPDGRFAPVYMDQSRGGYGFWDSMGKWILISSVLNNMNRGGYQPYYPPSGSYPGGSYPSGSYPGDSQSGHYGGPRSGSSTGAGAVLAIIGLIVVGVLVSAGIFMHRSGMNSKPRPLDARFTPPTRRNPMPPETSQSTGSALDEWINLPPGSFVTLSDQQALEDSQKRGDGLRGIDYKVESVGVVKDLEGFATWVFAHLNDGHQKLLLMVKGDESNADHRVYYATEDFRPAKREAVINRGDTWLFEAPADPHNFKPSHLRYAAEIPYSIDGAELIYVRKEHGERHGEYTEKPGFSGLGAQVATVVEYSTSDPTDNPELLVLEIATTTQKTGEVSLYLGCPIRSSEASIVRAA